MKAVILAAGYATRLYPLTENKPKCLLPVAGRTILDRLLEKLATIRELKEAVIVTNAKFYEQLTAWKQSAKTPLGVRLVNDGTRSNETRLGAVGDTALAIREALIKEELLLLASDNLFEEGFEKFLAFAAAKNAVMVGVHDLGDPSLAANKYGVLEVGADSRLMGMEEKPARPRSSLVGMGVYYFPRHTLGFIEDFARQKGAGEAPGYLIRWLFERNEPIFAWRFSGMWYDIGDFRSLEEADKILMRKEK